MHGLPNETKTKTSIPLFISLLPFLYYIDYAKKLYRYVGLPRLGEFSPDILLIAVQHGLPWKVWIAWIIYPAIYIGYGMLLYRYADKVENAINEPLKKLLPIILPVLFTVIIIANAAVFGSSNSAIMTKLGWCWGIGLLLFGSKIIDFKKLTNNNLSP